jgi:allophanate hydrolase subunit 2
MGVRLDGSLINCEGGSDIISDGICAGAIQINNAGQPMMLLADRQTVGGYAKPFVVIEADLSKAGQLRPGDKVRFTAVNPRKARMILLEDMIYMGGLVRNAEDATTRSYKIMGFKIRTR